MWDRVRDIVMVVLLVFFCVMSWNMSAAVSASAEKAISLVEEDNMHSASWDHCPGGGGNPTTMTVSDQDFDTFQAKYAQHLTAYPANCP